MVTNSMELNPIKLFPVVWQDQRSLDSFRELLRAVISIKLVCVSLKKLSNLTGTKQFARYLGRTVP